MISVLFLSVDGAADSVIAGHAHGSGAIHATDNPEPNSAPDSELDGDHCERCCHGHTPGISATTASEKTPFAIADHRAGRSAYVRNFAQAPPTPPPNA